MALEDLTGSKFISNLNSAWPAGTDLPDAGDDHIRGIKNVLKTSFPRIAGVVDRAHDSISRGSVPIGSVLPFYMVAAPTGWSRVTGLLDTKCMRVVASASAGGVAGGTHDPVLNDKIPIHDHTMLSTTKTSAADRRHQHAVSDLLRYVSEGTTGTPRLTAAFGSTYGIVFSQVTATGDDAPDHQHLLTNADINPNSGANAISWVPRYLDVILCSRTT